jgi:hypothetical protein
MENPKDITVIQKVNNHQLATISKNEFLKTCSPKAIAKICRNVNTVPAVFQSKLPSLAKVRKIYGENFSEGYVVIWITNLVEFFQVGKRMGENQILETAMLVLEDYYMLTLADINLVFTRAKKGFYGELYDRLDGAIILTWFRKYFEERCQEAENIALRKHDRHKDNGQPRTSDKEKAAHKKAFQQYQMETIVNKAK